MLLCLDSLKASAQKNAIFEGKKVKRLVLMSQMLNDVFMQNHQLSSRSPTSVTVVADAMVLPLFRLNRTNVGMV